MSTHEPRRRRPDTAILDKMLVALAEGVAAQASSKQLVVDEKISQTALDKLFSERDEVRANLKCLIWHGGADFSSLFEDTVSYLANGGAAVWEFIGQHDEYLETLDYAAEYPGWCPELPYPKIRPRAA